MSELKPCPFCGGAARAFKRTCDKDTRYDPADRAFPIVRCGACGACSEGDDWTEIQTAIDRWNRRAQPAQAGQVLSNEEIDDVQRQTNAAYYAGTLKDRQHSRAIEQAVLAKRVPMTEAQMLAAFAVAHPQDHADMQDGSPANAVERIGARNVYRRFERGVRAAEKFHGIVGEKGGA